MVLLSGDMKSAVERLSRPRAVFTTKTLIKYRKRIKPKSKDYTVNDIKITIGTGGRRKELLKQVGIKGSDMCMWLMDKPITKFHKPKIEALGKLLAVKNPVEEFE